MVEYEAVNDVEWQPSAARANWRVALTFDEDHVDAAAQVAELAGLVVLYTSTGRFGDDEEAAQGGDTCTVCAENVPRWKCFPCEHRPYCHGCARDTFTSHMVNIYEKVIPHKCPLCRCIVGSILE